MKHCHGDTIYNCIFCKHNFRVFLTYGLHFKNQHSKAPTSKEEKNAPKYNITTIVVEEQERKLGCTECGKLFIIKSKSRITQKGKEFPLL